ncbi:Glycosyltransferase, GT2 family [Paenibacillaceae bacterium GAS479]|nr:Glycosyltransferase, GT2 family [Paenibacillaceae bacterium GAS479]
MFGNKTYFDGFTWNMFPKANQISNTFTYEFWVKAEEEQLLDAERSLGNDGLIGKRYLVGPNFYPYGAAGCGISVGTNGISVYEHSVNHIPARLVYPYDFSSWQHVAIVSDNRKLRLYINGQHRKDEGADCVVDHLFPSLCLGGHQYGAFKGEVSEFRLWSTTRTEAELKANMRRKLNGMEKGIYFYRDVERGIVVQNEVVKNIAVSMIMPSHNRCPLNYFSLLCLDKQQFPLDQMEVVFLDDNSSDATATLYELINPGYSFIYVQSRKNMGRSKIRNMGARIAAGSTFIFIDAEMICSPDFVGNHVEHHLSGDRKVISGALKLKRIFTIIDPEFSLQQIDQLKECYSNHPVAGKLIDRFIEGDRTEVQLLPFDMMFDSTHLKKWNYSTPFYENILMNYGDKFENFHFPWMNLITNNASMTRRLFEEIGGFDENFLGFGWEDWELGYRAAQNGAIFIHDDSVINFHQDHSIPSDNISQARQNYLKFCEKYPEDKAVKLLALTMLPGPDPFNDLSEYLTEYNRLKAQYPQRFKAFYKYVDLAINLLPQRLLADDKEFTMDKFISKEEKAAVQKEVSIIRKMSTSPKLIELYKRLSK